MSDYKEENENTSGTSERVSTDEEIDSSLKDDSTNPKGAKHNKTVLLVLVLGLLLALILTMLPILFEKNDNSADVDSPLKSLTNSKNAQSPVLLNDNVSKENNDFFLNTIEGIDNTESAFVFTAKDIDEKELSEKIANGEMVRVDLYISFTGNKSLDTLLNNLESFREYINKESIVLVVHPVATTVDASVYIPEAIAQVADLDSSKAWNMLEQSLAVGSIRKRGDYGDDTIIRLLAKSAKDLGISDINDSSLKAKRFEQWIVKNQEEVNKTVQDFVPAVVINGEKVDMGSLNTLEAGSLFREIDKQVIDNE